MKKRNFTFRSSDGKTRIHAIEWVPDGEVRGVLQLVHGMVEFIGRYDRFARYMCGHGFYVVGHDILGHGASVTSAERHGYFGEPDGNRYVIMDIRALHRHTMKRYPELPYFMLGHSMGAFLVSQYITRFGEDLSGVILMGTAWMPAPALQAALGLCRVMARSRGQMYRSRFLFDLVSGSNNRRIENPRTRYDWLTRDTAVVDAFCVHPWNNFRFTVNAYYHMFRGLEASQKSSGIRRIPFDLPVFLASGSEDPVGGYGRGVMQVYQNYLSHGLTEVVMKLYAGDRHEILNETDHFVADRDIYHWMKAHM